MNNFNKSFAQAEELVEYLNSQKSSSLEFRIINNQIGTIAIYLFQEDYYTMALFFGVPFVEEVISYFEEKEEYEQCAAIVSQLRRLSESVPEHQEMLTY
jgi:pantothenate kinase